MSDFFLKETILIVNNDIAQLHILKKAVVEKLKYQVITATNVDEAIGQIFYNKSAPDMMLLDLGNARSSNWLKLIHTIKQKNADFPIIILTNYGEHEYATQAIEAGASDFLTKPVATARLGLSISNIARMQNLQKTIRKLEQKLVADGVNLPEKMAFSIANLSPIDDSGKIKKLRAIEEDAIRFALESSGNSMSKAARMLGIGRSTLYRKVDELDRGQISRANQTTRPTITTSSALLS
jgi:DNA-binding NtrC family response regulator